MQKLEKTINPDMKTPKIFCPDNYESRRRSYVIQHLEKDFQVGYMLYDMPDKDDIKIPCRQSLFEFLKRS